MKALGGGGGSFSKTSLKAAPAPEPKAKPKAKSLSHSQLQAQWEQNGRDPDGKLIKHVVDTSKVWTKADIDRARAQKERAEEEARQAKKPIAANSLEEEIVLVSGRPALEVAKERIAALSEKLKPRDAGSSSEDESAGAATAGAAASDSEGGLSAQLEELTLLEAMFVEDCVLISDSDEVTNLRKAVEDLDANAQDAEALAVLAKRGPLEFALQLTAEEPAEAATARAAAAAARAAAEAKDDEEDAAADQVEAKASAPLVASILLRVSLPFAYPTPGSPPLLYVEDAMITEAGAEIGSDKVLTSCGVLDEAALIKEMVAQAEESLPNPCVWELTTWLSEHAFEYITATWL